MTGRPTEFAGETPSHHSGVRSSRLQSTKTFHRTAGLLISSVAVLCALGLYLGRTRVEISPLEPGSPINRNMSGRQQHTYSIFLQENQYLHLTVNQIQIDVVVRVFGPEGQEVTLVDSPNGRRGPEPVMVVAQATGNHSMEVRSEASSQSGSYEIRVEELRRATEADRHKATAARLLNRGQQLAWRRGDALTESVETYGQALTSWRKALDVASEAETLDRMGRAFETMGREAEALEHYRLAIEAFSRVGLPDKEAVVLNRLGRNLRGRGEFQQALEAYLRALKLSQEANDRSAQATTLHNMALLHKVAGETHKALDLYERSLALWRDIGGSPRREATTLANIGEIYNSLGQFELALDPLREAFRLMEIADDRPGRAITLGGLASAHLNLGQLDLALKELSQALVLRRELQDVRGEAVTLNELGNIYYELKELQLALESYEQARNILDQLNDNRRIAYVLVNIGWIHLEGNASDLAVEYFEQALPTLRRLEDQRGEATALFGLARVTAQRANASVPELLASLSNAEEALDRIEAVRKNSYSQALRSSFLATKHHYYEFAIDVLMRLDGLAPDQGYAARAFVTSERSRSRSLLESLIEAQVDIRQGLDITLLERERTLQAQLNLKEQERSHIESLEPTGERIEALKSELRALFREYHNVQAQIRVSSPKYAALIHPQPLELSDIQQLLDQDTLLLEYSLGEDRSFLWLVSSSSIEGFRLPGRDYIETRARRVHDVLQLSSQPNVRVQARLLIDELSAILLGPTAGRLGNKRLMVVATGALQYIPFATLRASHAGNPESTPLVVDHEIVSLPSASVLAVLRQELEGRVPAPRKIAVLADPVFRQDDQLTGYEPLPSSAQEAEAILEMVSGTQSLKALGFEANRELVLSGALSTYQILHFATHGELNDTHPELSSIVLSQLDIAGKRREGHVRAHEIYNLDLPAELVVLSACETALGRETRGEGLIGLTHGFMYAGASRVIVSLWRVSDSSTTELMKRFYRGVLTDGLRPAAALRAAQISMLSEQAWEAPYHWAGFILQGDWR